MLFLFLKQIERLLFILKKLGHEILFIVERVAGDVVLDGAVLDKLHHVSELPSLRLLTSPPAQQNRLHKLYGIMNLKSTKIIEPCRDFYNFNNFIQIIYF